MNGEDPKSVTMTRLSDTQHRELAFWGMALIAVGLPLSTILMSVGQFVLLGNWLLEGDLRRRLRQFSAHPLSMVLGSVFLMYLIGTLWAPDLGAAWRDVQVKLPLVVLPLVMFTSKLPGRERLRQVLYLFVLGTVAGSLVGLVNYLGLSADVIVEKRHLSYFISHIRFGMMVVFSIFILGHFLFSEWEAWPWAVRVFTLAVMVWLFYFTVLLESATAYLIVIALLSMVLLRMLVRSADHWLKLAAALMLAGSAVAGGVYVHRIYQSQTLDLPFDVNGLPLHTANGREYEHYPERHFKENGHRMWNLVCQYELDREWADRSSMDINGSDLRGQTVRFTLMRYLTSLGLPKDSLGVHSLSETDVRNVELGFTNHRFVQRWGVSRRLAEFFWQWDNYRHTNDPNNSSLIQRWVYTQVGVQIVKEHWPMGVGTEGMVTAYNGSYELDDHGLLPQFRLIAHNQFLATAICLGVFGGAWFIIAFLFPLKDRWRNMLYLGFVVTMGISFLSDNTLGSQAGATLYAFMNALLIVLDSHRREELP
ncbi:MAG: O-antigen ligase family protein [Flavobacteriales bacterium]|nr:O-antigen ligase family protein [Flavobacteriales bacterium]